MFFRIFDLPDAVALTRALIPWTAAILTPLEGSPQPRLLQRTNTRQEPEEDFDARYATVVEAARASRAAHLGELLASGAERLQQLIARLRTRQVRGETANS